MTQHYETASSITAHMECPRKYYLSYQHGGAGISPITQSDSLFFGKIGHGWLERYYPDALRPRPFGYDVAKDWLLHLDLPERKGGAEILQAHIALMDGYRAHYGADDMEVLGNEEEYQCVTHDGIGLRGKKDLYVRQDGDEWLLDHKFMRFAQSPKAWQRSPQGVVYAMSEVATGRRPVGIIWNIVRKPDIYKRKEESVEAWGKRVYDDVQKRTDFYYKRIPVRYHDDAFVQLRGIIASEYREMKVRVGGAADSYRQNLSQCYGKYGECPYFSVCQTGAISPSDYRMKLRRHEELA